MAVEILGLDVVPTAGDQFNVLQEEKEAREIIAYRTRKELEAKVAKRSVKSLDSMLKVVGGKSAKLLPVIIKADVNGSIEAIIGTLTKLNTNEVEIDVIHSATGAINESDINLASVSNAIILGFNVRANSNAVEMAKSKGKVQIYIKLENLIRRKTNEKFNKRIYILDNSISIYICNVYNSRNIIKNSNNKRNNEFSLCIASN